MIEKHFFRKGQAFISLLAVTIYLCSSPVFARGLTDTYQPQYKIISLTHIPAEKGVQLLDRAHIGTVSKLPAVNTVLITAQPGELSKAAAILALVDAKQQFDLITIPADKRIGKLPPSRQIAARIGNISIGTFSNPPVGPGPAKALIDIHDDAVIIVAPAGQLQAIASAIKQLQKAPALLAVEGIEPQKTAAEPQELPRPSHPTRPQKVAVKPEKPGEAAKATITAQLYALPPIPNGNETLKLQLPERLSIVDLLTLVGEYLQLNFMYDPAQIKGEVTLKLHGRARGDLRVKDLYALLESVLKFRGFAMTRRGNLVTIVPAAEAPVIDPVLLKADEGRVQIGDVIVTSVFQLKYIDTASAQNFLTAMKLTTSVTPIPETGVLVVTGYAYRMPRIKKLLEIIDQPGKPKEFKFRQLKYIMAKTLATKVKTLAEQLGTVSVSIAAPSAPPTSIQRRPGESLTSYQRRLEAARRAPTRTTPAAAAAKTGVYLDADERTNRILMIGYAEQLKVVEQLIDSLDVEQQDPRTMKLYKIEHVDAEEARKKLQEFGIIGGAGRATTTVSRITGPSKTTPGTAARPPTTRAATTTAATEALVEEPQVVVIETTNSLLVNATAEQHTQIARVLQYIDSKTEEEEIPYKIYQLENQDPESMAQTLTQLIQETVKDKEGKIQQVIKKTEEEITIIPDKNTFSLIVYASKKNQEWIANLIKQLDKRRPQVLIDVTLVEVSRTDEFNADLNIISAFPDLTTTTSLLADAVLPPGATDSGRRRFIELRSSGTGTGFYADKHINFLLNAMQTKNYGRILAKPKILVNDNETGTISTTDTTYVTKTSSIPVLAGAAGQQTQLIQTAVDYQGYDAGVQLDITPHISEGNLLRLEITLTRSDFRTITGEKPPDTTSSDIKTIVTVPDGSTIILGGLVKLNQTKGGTKVPIIGDLPLVGGLFRNMDNSDIQRKLYIFVKAEVIRPAEAMARGLPDLEKISERNRAAFEKSEAGFQRYQDWPGIKPKPMEPVKVLEAE